MEKEAERKGMHCLKYWIV